MNEPLSDTSYSREDSHQNMSEQIQEESYLFLSTHIDNDEQ